jgi:hypothetical protein
MDNKQQEADRLLMRMEIEELARTSFNSKSSRQT